MEIRIHAAATALVAAMAASSAAETFGVDARCAPYSPDELVVNLAEWGSWEEPWHLRYYEGDSGTMYVIADTRRTLGVRFNYGESPERNKIWFLAAIDEQRDLTCLVAGSEDILSELELYGDRLILSCSPIGINKYGAADIENGALLDYSASGPLEGRAVVIETGPSDVHEYWSSVFFHEPRYRSAWHILLNKDRKTCWLAH